MSIASLQSDVLAADPMEKFTVLLGIQGDAVVTFIPKVDLPYADPYSYRIEHAPNPTAATWTTIDTVIVSWTVLDVTRYRWDVLAESWYRVVLIDADGGEHPSRSVQAGNRWDRRGFLVAREACRQAYQVMRLHNGIDGYLLKVMETGTVCTACTNEITEQSVNSDCPTCFGTGLVGGYYPAYSCMLSPEPKDKHRDHQEQFSHTDVLMRRMYGVNFPPFDVEDVWVEKQSGRRWKIKTPITEISGHQGIALVVGLSLHAIETTDVLYSLETPDEV